MVESKILMHPSHRCLALSGVRFEIVHSEEFFNPSTANLTPPHIHNCFEIFLNVSSDASFFTNNSLYPLQYGDVVLSRPNDIHVCTFNKTYTHEHFCLWIDLSDGAEQLPFLFYKDESPLFRFEQEQQKRLIDLFFKLERLCKNGESDLQKTACFLEILSYFEKMPSPEEQTARLPEVLQKILNDIHVNFAEIHHVNQLTDRYFVSHATMNRWFRKYLHTSPREYLESRKLAHAAKLLAEGATVTEACMASGFPCCSHFIGLFKKKFGKTPLKYKKGLKVNIKNAKNEES